MSIKIIGKFKKKQESKPHQGLGFNQETESVFDHVYALVIAAKEQMSLHEVGKGYKETGCGIAIAVASDAFLFYILESSKSEFFWIRQGKGFGLSMPNPGDYWCFSNWGALWVKLDDSTPRRDQLWQSFSSRYLENDPPPPPPKKPHKASSEDTGSNSGNEMNHRPVNALTPEQLKSLGF
ncbi:MAG: hypothetical protein ABTQ26_06235 [Azonexus sp.]